MSIGKLDLKPLTFATSTTFNAIIGTMWSAPAKVTLPNGKTLENVVFGEYEQDNGSTTILVFVEDKNKEAYMSAGGFGSTHEHVLFEGDIIDSVDISLDGKFDVQRLETGNGVVVVDWR